MTMDDYRQSEEDANQNRNVGSGAGGQVAGWADSPSTIPADSQFGGAPAADGPSEAADPYGGQQRYADRPCSFGQPHPANQPSAQPDGAMGYGAQPPAAQPYGGRTDAARPRGNQGQVDRPYDDGQPYGSQPYGGQSGGGQPCGSQPHGWQPDFPRIDDSQQYGGQPYDGRPYGSRPYAGQTYPAQPYPAQSNLAQPCGGQTYPVQVQGAPYSPYYGVQPHQPYGPVPAAAHPAPVYPGYPYSPYAQPVYAKRAPYAVVPTRHSRLTAGLLSIFLGIFGIGNFYLGRTGQGMGQLMLSLIGFFFFFTGPILSVVWGVIEGVLILTSSPGSRWHRDAYGQELID